MLRGYDTVSQPVTACIPGSWRLVSPRAATMLLMCNTVPSHFSSCTRALLLSFRTQKMRMTKTSVSPLRMRMTYFLYRTASITRLTINTSASSWLNRPSSSPTITILGARVHVQRRRERSLLFALLFIMTSLLGRGEVRVRL